MSKVKGEQLDLTEAAITRQARQDATPMVSSSLPVGGIMDVIQAAVQNGATVENLERLLAMHERILADNARREFYEAMRQVQAVVPAVVRSKTNSHTNSTYADYDSIHKVITPLYTAQGFSVSHDEIDSPHDGQTRYRAIVRHVGGHREDFHLDLPLDGTGSGGKTNKTAIQAKVSSSTYAKRTLESRIFGVACAGEDDDGNGGEPVAMISARDSDDIAACLRDMPKGKVDEFWLSLDKGSLAEMTAAEAAKVLPWCRKCVREAKDNSNGGTI